MKQETHLGTARGTVHTYPFKREAEGDLTLIVGEWAERFEGAGLEDWSDVVTSQGMLTSPRSWDSLRSDPPQEPPEGA